jgi:hypothetical protein
MLTSAIDSFKEYFVHQENSHSLYQEQLTHWLKFIRRDQLFIVSMDNLLANTASVLESVSKFLNLPSALVPSHTSTHIIGTNSTDGMLPHLTTRLKGQNHELECDCETFDTMKKEFDDLRVEEKTLTLISDSGVKSGKPASEPFFSSFNYQRTCKDNITLSMGRYNEIA